MPQREFTGALFDVSLYTNSLFADSQKIPYQLKLAKAIGKARNEGYIGVPLLDIYRDTYARVVKSIPGFTSSSIDHTLLDKLHVVDLSVAKFAPSGSSSVFPTAWGASLCPGTSTSQGDYGSFYDTL
jgi:hypothetical protein